VSVWELLWNGNWAVDILGRRPRKIWINL